MSEDIQALKKQVEDLEELLREVLRRLPDPAAQSFERRGNLSQEQADDMSRAAI
jgi:hypothetical protein